MADDESIGLAALPVLPVEGPESECLLDSRRSSSPSLSPNQFRDLWTMAVLSGDATLEVPDCPLPTPPMLRAADLEPPRRPSEQWRASSPPSRFEAMSDDSFEYFNTFSARSPPPPRFSKTVTSIKMSAAAHFRLPEPQQKLLSAAALLPPPPLGRARPTPRSISPRSLQPAKASMRSWRPRPVRYDPEAGRYVMAPESKAEMTTKAAPAPPPALAAPPALAPAPEFAPATAPAASGSFESGFESAGTPIGTLVPLPLLMTHEAASFHMPSPRSRTSMRGAGALTARETRNALGMSRSARASRSLGASPREALQPLALHGNATEPGAVQFRAPRPTPRRDRVLEQLRCGHGDNEGMSPLPPLPAPGDPLSRVDEEVLAVALSNPAHALALANTTRHTGISRLGRRPQLAVL